MKALERAIRKRVERDHPQWSQSQKDAWVAVLLKHAAAHAGRKEGPDGKKT